MAIQPMDNPKPPMSTKAKVATGGTLVAIVGTAAAALLTAEIPKDEGVVYRGYRDPVGIPTKCMGDTRDVVVGKVYTRAECLASMDKALVDHAAPVLRCAPAIRGNTNIIYASVSYAYNVGPSRFCKRAAPLFQAGRWREACATLAKPDTAAGRVLPGLVKRRKKEVSFCMLGVEMRERGLN